jgi:predicted DsbA family dithiol-disulfide isomerase
MKITYYLEVLSSWCAWVEPTWDALQARYGDRVKFEWKIALMNPGDFPTSREQCDWFYQRSGTMMRSPVMLNSGWFEARRKGHYPAPNLVAEAGRDFGFEGDELRRALAHAGVREGRKIGDLATAVAVAAQAGRINPKKLRAAAESAAVRARVDASTREFFAHQLSQRPAFVLTDAIGDKAVFSGLVQFDTAAYAAHAAHHPAPPV